MEIRELNLAAFGPFTERLLAFDPAMGGLQLVYGPNEAGKSSALRGLKALLYGVDERSTDDFVHAKDKLRIAGRVCASNGDELVFVRRKGHKNTLLSSAGEALDENALFPFLRGVSPELFETLFGIDHQALVQGGREILEQKGEVGQALFSASLGSHRLHAVLGRLDEEADGLFRPRGSNQTINSALKIHADLKKEIKDRSLSSREWDERRLELARTHSELEQIQATLSTSRVDLNRLKRMQRVLPKLARRRELRQQIESLGDVVILTRDFGERRLKATGKLETAQVIHKTATARLESLQVQIQAYSIRPEVLEHSEWIENLQERLGSHRKAMQDRPHLDAEYKQLLRDIESLLKQLRPDLCLAEIGILRGVIATSKRISELGKQYSVSISRVQGTEKLSRETQTQLHEAQTDFEKLAAVVIPDAIGQAVVLARKSGDLDRAIQTSRRDVNILKEQCETDLARLSLWTGSLEEISRLPVPNRETINRFEAYYAAIDQRIQRLRDKKDENTDALRNTIRRLGEIQLAGQIPIEEELIQARTERDQVWRLLRRQWIDGEDVTAQARAIDRERALPEAFEDRLSHADELADRLRREADRVHAKASLMAEQANAKQRAEAIEQQIDECAAQKQQMDEEWGSLWAPCQIQPQAPREMRAWLDTLESLRSRIEQSNTLKLTLIDSENARATQIQAVKQSLQSLGKDCPATDSLEAVLLQGEAVLAELDGIHRQRESLDKEIKNLERRLNSARMDHQSANNELLEWKEHWTKAVANFGLDGDASPAEADDVIEKLRQMFTKQDESDKLLTRIQAIDRDAENFLEDVRRAVVRIAPELSGQGVYDAVPRLNTILSDNRTRQSRREQIEKDLRQARLEIQESEVLIQAMIERQKRMCEEARCGSAAELEDAERRSTDALRLRAEIENIENEISSTGEGAALQELEREAERTDPNTLPGQIDTLSKHIEELEPTRTALAEAKGRAAKELELMDGGDQAAALADQAQSVLASIRSDAQRYLHLKLAARILRDQIERYRKENQGPLLKRASDHFTGLTRGSFAELRTDINEKDEPVLVGIRPNQERVHVEGMSSGTRDQLYLALRLASLEKYMQSSEALPFIVDDILVDFDDERTESALNALAILAEKTQVILFTHHSRVVEQARKLRTAVPVRVHDL